MLGIKRDQFLQIAMIAQGDFLRLLTADTKKRQEIFRSLFKTNLYKRLQDALKEQASQSKQRYDNGMQALRQHVGGIQCNEGDEFFEEAERAKEDTFPTEDVVVLLDKLISRDEEERANRDRAIEKAATRMEQLGELIERARQQQDDCAQLATLEGQKAHLMPELEKARETGRTERGRQAERDELRNRIATLDASLGGYEKQERLLTNQSMLQTEVGQLDDVLAEDERTCTGHEAKRDALQAESDTLAGCRDRREKLNRRRDEAEEEAQRLGTLLKRIEEYEALQQRRADAQQKHEAAANALAAERAKDDEAQQARDLMGRIDHELPSYIELEGARQDASKTGHELAERKDEHTRMSMQAKGLADQLSRLREECNELSDAGIRLVNQRSAREALAAQRKDLSSRENALDEYRMLTVSLNEAKARLDKARTRLSASEQRSSERQEMDRRLALIRHELPQYAEKATRDAELARCRTRLEALSRDEATNRAELVQATEQRDTLRTEREGLAGAEVTLERRRQEWENAQERLAALDELTKDLAALEDAQSVYGKLQEEYRRLEEKHQRKRSAYDALYDAFFREQAGILAQTLVEGEACPVCGSTTHPHKAHTSEMAPSEAELKRAQDEAEQARTRVEQASGRARAKRATVDAQTEILQRRVAALWPGCSIEEAATRVTAERTTTKQRIETLRHELTTGEARVLRARELDEQIATLEQSIIQLREKQQQLQADIALYKADEAKLVGRRFELSFAQRALADEEVERLQREMRSIDEALSVARAEHTQASQRCDELRGRLNLAHEQLNDVADLSDVDGSLQRVRHDLAQVDEESRKVELQIQHEERRADRCAQAEAEVAERESQYKECTAQKVEAERAIAGLGAQLSGLQSQVQSLEEKLLFSREEQAVARRKQLEAQIAAHEKALQHAQAELDECQARIERVNGEIVQAKNQLAPDVDTSDIAGARRDTSHLLEERKRELNNLGDQLAQAERDVRRSEELTKLIEQKRHELEADREVMQGHKQHRASLSASLQEVTRQVDDLTKGLPYPSRGEALTQRREMQQRVESMRAALDAAAKRLRELEGDADNLDGQIRTVQKSVDEAGDLDADALAQEREEVRSRQQELQERQQNLHTRLVTNRRARRDVRASLKKVQERERTHVMLQNLSATANGGLGGKDKVMLETYVQQTYFERMIQRANIRLLHMTGGQYEFKRQEEAGNRQSQSGLELEVIDHYNGTTRSVRTLSGGESFMAALSLALGLADEIQSSAGGLRIEAMFVDEGFGSLDENALEQAIDALQSVAADTKLVGIISHVGELKERIDRQVIVTKKKTGGSSVEVMV